MQTKMEFIQEEQRKTAEGVVEKDPVKLGNCRQKIGSLNHKEAAKLKDSAIENNLLVTQQ